MTNPPAICRTTTIDDASYTARVTAAATAHGMPCLQAANNGNLQQLSIFGTSMRSLADTQALVAALTSGPAAAAAAVGGSKSAVAQQIDVLQLVYQQGCVLEVPCPDCAAHGVGVAVHLFSRGGL
jgi:hypothetical protein